jgi:DNA-binding NarL/FixJ family response regulator
MTHKRVLLVDDMAPLRGAVASVLQTSFDVVGMVSDGPTALKAAMTLEPDLIVLDISMPGMSGIEVARELQMRASQTRIVFLTVHEDPDILASCLDAGGLGYVVKVFMDTDLIPAMNEALAGRVFVSQFSSQEDSDLS